MDFKERIESLTATLKEANYRYYVLDDPTMQDFEYDRLLRELEEIQASAGLHREVRMPSRSLDLLEKFVQFLHAEHILQAHQRHRMGHFRKLMQGLTAHMLGGGIGLGIFRMGCFQLLQLPQQTVFRWRWSM